ncbi:hypothetical protein F3J40_02810 [Pantoea sp. Acro-835]|uniref:Uncharacterized protein n=1 Tax=Candidatus Pantoea multigeneris TaxID=2608357 RepID=A0ABX0RAP4_9GAMM|nr:hypothetical protein [Pantoea multigeneris]
MSSLQVPGTVYGGAIYAVDITLVES